MSGDWPLSGETSLDSRRKRPPSPRSGSPGGNRFKPSGDRPAPKGQGARRDDQRKPAWHTSDGPPTSDARRSTGRGRPQKPRATSERRDDRRDERAPRPRPRPAAAPRVEATGEGIRLQKILSTAGVASRRASEQLIAEGRVMVNGETVRGLGSKADPARDDIRVDGRRIRTDIRHRYILLYKPRGYVTTRHDPEGRPTVIDLLGRDVGYVYPVGRLDYDSEGLLLLTSDGALAEHLTHPRHEVAKLYEVIVMGAPEQEAIDKLRRGIYLDGHRTAPAEVYVHGTVKGARPTTRLTITLREGRNRQVRNMCQAVGLPVRDLRRIQIGAIGIGRLRPGEWRELTPREVASLHETGDGGDSPRERRPTRRAARPGD
ncbi:MAG: rRNA pseudouridine synthase [Acidobacteria bacterium]|nr:rRNA pseudouridine synthase [Acidobacteriota bacterium]